MLDALSGQGQLFDMCPLGTAITLVCWEQLDNQVYESSTLRIIRMILGNQE
jgi:hypothetical protein